EKISGILVKIKMSAGADGRLYGSVTSKDVADALLRDFGIEIDRRKIIIPEPIKAYGNYTLDVKLYPEITGKINILVCEK
ncbi:MAG TPA: 50S ribosomal protein L9, partial [Bacillota bacterium]|nr:50S ribosomal protein L9 [Bacillota bacterium]